MHAPLFHSKRHKDDVYVTMFKAIDCGPFDGGCVSFAMALQKVFGGDVYVICGRQGPDLFGRSGGEGPQHAVLRLPDGRFMDAGTVGTAAEIINTFNVEECFGRLRNAYIRQIEPGDLQDAPRDDALIDNLAALLAKPESPRRAPMKRQKP
jgi:hypothetical protein